MHTSGLTALRSWAWPQTRATTRQAARKTSSTALTTATTATRCGTPSSVTSRRCSPPPMAPTATLRWRQTPTSPCGRRRCGPPTRRLSSPSQRPLGRSRP
ncbi:hypothetical protein I4F81_003555 [Pyropia yezoensis]|uniref:Uncharacterized protein n=1 Tax=Pyropia yezoensis TaxID=2788 RepID=A0ACC3BSP5_PYRYE|nr:hypothetical protein I4F81_003555 [Neopyropia yezoensis]